MTSTLTPLLNDYPHLQALTHGLNPNQAAATIHGTGALLVLAGAGSGKTRVLTHRIAFLLQGAGINGLQPIWPSQLLAVTFTNKAAKEMRLRLGQIVGEQTANEVWMGTFHSVCVRLLRRDIVHYQTPNGRQWKANFVIYDETESVSVLKAILKELQLDEKLYPPRGLKHQISALKNQGLDAYAYASNATDFKAERLAQIFDLYEAKLAENNALDFDDLLLTTVKLLKQQPSLLANYHNHFRHVLVDEFQDTNDVQADLIRLISTGSINGMIEKTPEQASQHWHNRSLTVVGDVDQSIYSWRGANFRIILGFQKDFDPATLIKLEENYRSTGTILKAANCVIENNSERLPKELRAVKGQGKPIYLYEATDERDEAMFVIDKLLNTAKQSNKRGRDCCILYRTNVQSRAIEDVLIARGIPYTMIGGLKFYERREVKDVLAYLTVLFNPDDSFSVKRVLNTPRRGIGPKSIEGIEAYAAQHGLSFFEALKQYGSIAELKGKALQGVTAFVETISKLQENVQAKASVDSLMLDIRSWSGYDKALEEDDPNDMEGRLENLDELVSVARQFHSNLPEGELGDFLAQLSLMSDLDNAPESDPDRLTLMTMHAAKGLEFPIVAVVGMEEGLFPHGRSLADASQMEEERRLMYVALTRAEDELILSFARRRLVFGEVKYGTPSRFLSELPNELLTGAFCLESEAPTTGFGGRQESGSSRGWAGKSGTTSTKPTGSERSGSGSNHLAHSSSGTTEGRIRLNTPTLGGSASTPAVPSTASTAIPSSTFNEGARVSHAKWGAGTVVQVLGQGAKVLYNVQFDGLQGKKLLDPRFAKLDGL
jgi:DNA helicase-2/ATP-dependent DNA helicase PcrA